MLIRNKGCFVSFFFGQDESVARFARQVDENPRRSLQQGVLFVGTMGDVLV